MLKGGCVIYDIRTIALKYLPDRGRIRYIPFPSHLEGAYQSYTQADLGNLRQAGCDVEFRPVETGVRDYLDQLSG